MHGASTGSSSTEETQCEVSHKRLKREHNEAQGDCKTIQALDSCESTLSGVDKGILPTKRFLFLELCAGSAVLSATARHKGYSILPVDYARNRHDPKCHICQLDLSKDHAWEVLQYIINTCDVIAVHCAPPCGTCSKARGIPLEDGSAGPPELRSEDSPLGLPHLSPTDRVKVEAANQLYERMAAFLEFLNQKNIPWVMENPTNSWLWSLPFFESMIKDAHFAHCHACAFGSTRKKKTSFLSNDPDIRIMQRFCEEAPPHDHEPWGYNPEAGFATAMEAQYPEDMCQQLVQFLDNLCQKKGFSLQTSPKDKPRIAKQPRGRATPQLIPEYNRVITVTMDELPQLNTKQCLETSAGHIPAGSKLLRTEKKGDKVLTVWGIYHGFELFAELAKQLWHPFDLAVHMPDHILKCLHLQLTLSPVDLAKHRIITLKRWTSMATMLNSKEQELKQCMDPGVKSVMKHKRILLMRQIAEDMAWRDQTVFEEMTTGFRIVGAATTSNLFPMGLTAASISEAELMSDARFLKPALLGKVRSDGETEHGAELRRQTYEEAAEKGWLDGPYSAEALNQRFDNNWLPVRRFPLMQKGKLRLIDDFKENRLNQTYSSTERATLYAMDHLLWASLALMRLYSSGGEFVFELDDGHTLRGFVHKDWIDQEVLLHTTAVDLKAAYKQLPLHTQDYNKAVVALWNGEERCVECYVSKTLPFGASASVHHFLRVSAFLQAAGTELGVLWTNYFDDFPVVSHRLHTASTMSSIQGMLKLFGFAYAEDKLKPFDTSAEMLGVVMDLAMSRSKQIRVHNKPSRTQELTEAIDTILTSKTIIPAELPSVLGRLQYADSNVWGRAGKIAMAELRELGHLSREPVFLDEVQCLAFDTLKRRLCSGKPKLFVADQITKPSVVFTDGALEYEGDIPIATIGGVFLRDDGLTEVFGCRVPESLMARWQQTGKTHVIGLVELYACAVALRFWKHAISNDRLIIFTDNWGALDVLVRGSSPHLSWRELLLCLEDPDEDNFQMWVARVPSQSNCADAPSRGSLEELKFLEPFEKVIPVCPVMCEKLESIV